MLSSFVTGHSRTLLRMQQLYLRGLYNDANKTKKLMLEVIKEKIDEGSWTTVKDIKKHSMNFFKYGESMAGPNK